MGWEYYARPLRVIDGDSVVLEVDLGFRVRKELNCRLYGINAPELNSQDEAVRDKAKLAKKRLNDLIDAACARGLTSSRYPLLVETFKPLQDKYGRWLVAIYCNQMIDGVPDGTVNQVLVKEGLADVYLP